MSWIWTPIEQLTDVVGTDLQGFIPSHDQSDLLCLLVLEQPDIAGTALLPVEIRLDESEQLGPPAQASAH